MYTEISDKLPNIPLTVMTSNMEHFGVYNAPGPVGNTRWGLSYFI